MCTDCCRWNRAATADIFFLVVFTYLHEDSSSFNFYLFCSKSIENWNHEINCIYSSKPRTRKSINLDQNVKKVSIKFLELNSSEGTNNGFLGKEEGTVSFLLHIQLLQKYFNDEISEILRMFLRFNCKYIYSFRCQLPWRPLWSHLSNDWTENHISGFHFYSGDLPGSSIFFSNKLDIFHSTNI